MKTFAVAAVALLNHLGSATKLTTSVPAFYNVDTEIQRHADALALIEEH